MPKRIGDLHLAQDLAFERREWRAERIGWVAMALFVIAALLGLFGQGPISASSVSSPDGSVAADFNRFTRRGSPTSLTVRISPALASDGKVTIAFDDHYLRSFRIDNVMPNADQMTAGDGRYLHTFLVDGGGTYEIEYQMTAEVLWGKSGTIDVDGTSVEVSHFFYP